ncbi:hypothetical protein NLJ89_g7964 [Agrocybe chaxingu]|uniref:Uncharacterized protein n=1 Tax=Agrocybe chaxingu TaxID=84603 RepID=A0A9W8JVN0_9AGAR|nr:hypothetical protein NLJ89_g7964 [Agrocybe chaxingu]
MRMHVLVGPLQAPSSPTGWEGGMDGTVARRMVDRRAVLSFAIVISDGFHEDARPRWPRANPQWKTPLLRRPHWRPSRAFTSDMLQEGREGGSRTLSPTPVACIYDEERDTERALVYREWEVVGEREKGGDGLEKRVFFVLEGDVQQNTFGTSGDIAAPSAQY